MTARCRYHRTVWTLGTSRSREAPNVVTIIPHFGFLVKEMEVSI